MSDRELLLVRKFAKIQKIYQSWLKRTEHITCDCDYCGNKRYTFSLPMVTSNTKDFNATINACPSCNFEDLQITQKVDDSFMPLDKFVLIKKGELDIAEL